MLSKEKYLFVSNRAAWYWENNVYFQNAGVCLCLCFRCLVCVTLLLSCFVLSCHHVSSTMSIYSTHQWILGPPPISHLHQWLYCWILVDNLYDVFGMWINLTKKLNKCSIPTQSCGNIRKKLLITDTRSENPIDASLQVNWNCLVTVRNMGTLKF